MTSQPEVVILESARLLAEDAAARVLAALNAVLLDRPFAHLVITGGGVLEEVLSALDAPAGRDTLDWQRVHVWWGDERYVPADSDDRNDKPAFAKLFDHVPVDPQRVHRMPSSDAGFGDDADAAADSYAAELAAAARDDASATAGGDAAVPAFDVVLLGIGPDGHCCSLFPENPGVYELDASVIAVHDAPKPPSTRLSLTFPALDAASEVWFIASGDGKADAVAKALSGAKREQVPSAGPRGRHRTLWLIDQDAAAKLPK